MGAMKKSKKKATKKAKSSKKKTGTKPVGSKIGFIPAGDKVLVKPTAQEEMTSFGIIIPDSAKEKPEQGVVVAVGSGKVADDGSRTPIAVSVGDKVMFNKYGFDEIKINGTEYYLVSEANILGVFN